MSSSSEKDGVVKPADGRIPKSGNISTKGSPPPPTDDVVDKLSRDLALGLRLAEDTQRPPVDEDSDEVIEWWHDDEDSRSVTPVVGAAAAVPAADPCNGRWSSFSWSSLYDRGTDGGTDSSLSWAEDELEKEATDRVKSIFEEIDAVLYDDEDYDPSTSILSKEILEECQLWKSKFPHLRVTGKSIHPLIDAYTSPRSQFTLTASQTGAKLKQMPKETGSSESEDNAEYGETTFAEHFDESSQDPPLIEGERYSTKFQRDPKKYLEDKLMSGLFKKVWATVVPRNLQAPVSVLAEDIIAEEDRSRRHMQDVGNGQRFSSIEEDMVMSNSGFDQQRLFSQRQAAKRNVSPPLSDLNPISLPDLTSRPSVGSAPPARIRPPGKLQSATWDNRKRLTKRAQYSPSFQPAMFKPPSTAPAIRGRSFGLQPRDVGTASSDGSRESYNSSRNARIFRARSKSGSPPHAAGHQSKALVNSNGYSIFSNDTSDLSLPPISNVSSASSMGFFTSSRSGSAHNRYRGQKSKLALVERDFQRPQDIRYAPKSAKKPTFNSLPRGMSISGTRLKRLDLGSSTTSEIGAISRVATSTGARSKKSPSPVLTPSLMQSPTKKYHNNFTQRPNFG